MLKVVPNQKEESKEISSLLDALARDGAKQMLLMALRVEVDDYVNRHKNLVDDNGCRLVVKNGVGRTRTITVGSGSIDVRAPRVDDRRDGEKFLSSILPPYLRKSPKVESLLPLLYLKGLSTNDFKTALSEFLGDGTLGLSPASIAKLKKQWDAEYESWGRRKITKKYVYIWADGVNVSVRLGEDKKICLLVILGATEDGDKEVLAVHPGYRESADSWGVVLRSLIDRGLTAPLLAIGDGALGFWKALRGCEGFEKTEEQRCWVHKIANVLDKLPKRIQVDAKKLLHEMMKAATEKDALKARQSFEKLYNDKYPKSVDCLVKNWSELITFFKYPALHWQHIRTTNPIESSFATVKLRTKVTKGAGSKAAATVMAFKLLLECEKRWRKLRGYQEIQNLLKGLAYKDGIMIPPEQHHETAAS